MGGQRKFRAQRCDGCGLHDELCVCAMRPRLELETRVVVVQHNRERHKPTNSGRHLPQVLVNCALTRYADRDAPFDPRALDDPELDYALLFHRSDGDPVAGVPELSLAQLRARAQLRATGRRRAVVVLDGTWAQASRMSRRIPEVARIPTFTLPPGPPSVWTVRSRDDPARLGTFEAVIRVVELLEGAGPAGEMRRWFHELTARMLFMKGRQSSPAVPASWGRETGTDAEVGGEVGGERPASLKSGSDGSA